MKKNQLEPLNKKSLSLDLLSLLVNKLNRLERSDQVLFIVCDDNSALLGSSSSAVEIRHRVVMATASCRRSRIQ